MIKELILAIILGSLLGFGFTGGYLALKKSPNSPPVITSTSPTPTVSNDVNAKLTPTVIPTQATNTDGTQSAHKITIDSPENEALISTSTVTIKGSTSPQSSLVINTPIKSYFATADNAGNFSLTVDVDSGPNFIHIDSYDSEDNTASAQILITYSTAKI